MRLCASKVGKLLREATDAMDPAAALHVTPEENMQVSDSESSDAGHSGGHEHIASHTCQPLPPGPTHAPGLLLPLQDCLDDVLHGRRVG